MESGSEHKVERWGGVKMGLVISTSVSHCRDCVNEEGSLYASVVLNDCLSRTVKKNIGPAQVVYF